ncbi:MAG: ribosome biogenesis/translation initiation ATPase RLI [Thaumarchaeota archaeon]|nr:MAG: ribosome biogenesis/translation initiation ATPase RLI [Nitrososphaerota archaeon]RLG04973.1 MAG: ribosome biogenesis/translation initiation ATPase RLI [Nitrososphaerota archaeon]
MQLRVAVLDRERCDPRKCGLECIRFCPKVRSGVEVVRQGEDGYPIIVEALCIGCGICAAKCPFKAITIVNLPQELESDLIHQYGPNAFRLYRLPYPEPGSVIGLIGKNGTGKTTALQILARVLKPNLGKLDGGDEGYEEVAKQFRGTLLQDYFSRMSRGEIKVSYKPQYIDKIPRIVKGRVGEILKKIADPSRLRNVIELFELGHLLDREVSALSGGELQRLALAACLSKDADTFIIDEPSSFLDIRQRFRAAAAIRSILGRDVRILVCDHDLAVLDYLSDKVFVLYGRAGVFGIVSGPFGVREGINVFLDGYIPSENVRFRSERIVFQARPPSQLEVVESGMPLEWPEMTKTYEGFKLEVRSGRIYPGEVVGILGPNGIGKTTFIKLLAGIETSDEGYKLEFKSVSYKPQYPEPRDAVVEQALREAAGSRFDTDLYWGELIKPLGLERLLDRSMSELSGGELQKVSIAETLSRDAEIYLLDEPSAYLDVEERYLIARVLKRVTRDKRAYTFLVDHDLMVLDFASTRLMVFSGNPGIHGIANPPTDLRSGFNSFLKEVGITFRRDPDTKRPRANKPGSQLDKLQKAEGEYYYLAA